MSARSGEECKYTGDFKCRQCGELVHVEAGLTIPKCPR